MELVYLWVEEYKNIKRQGFNFSPRFECTFYDKYDENNQLLDNCELEIKPKEHIKNFFGDNINITAIVGKNGSGKSSLLECLHSILFNIRDFDYILVFNDGQNHYKSNIRIETELTSKEITDTYTSIYSNDSTEYQNQFNIKKENILKNLLSSSLENNFQLTTFMYVPTIIEIKSIGIDEHFRKTIEYDYTNYGYDSNITDDENRRVMYGQEDERSSLLEIENDYHKYLIIVFIGETGDDAFDYIDGLLNEKTLLGQMQESEVDYLLEDDFNTYFINIDTRKSISELIEKEREIYLNYHYFFKFDFIDSKNRRYNNLSHGERTIFGQFISMYYIAIQNYRANNFFLFDEAELSLHPNWQKNYINELINMLHRINKKFHFILTSHSPFLLSDLSKQNTIFLDTYESENDKSKEEYPNLNLDDLQDGYCINVSQELTLKPFGANIHTLLSDGFFMEGGLMGEFAKGKIQEIMDFLNDKKTIEEISTKEGQIKQVIESIGEDLLRMKLLDMYYEKFKDDELEREKKQLEEQRKEIEKRIKSIEDKQK